MAIAVWPVTLPIEPLVRGYSESAPNLLLRTEADQGPARVRRKCTAVPWTFNVTMNMTATQASAFDTFVRTTLQGGALRFEFTNGRTGDTEEVRMVPISQQMMYSVRRTGATWEIAFILEALP